MSLSPEIEHLLLEISDLDPNAVGDDDGYWTGVPLPDIRTYALMKTWPAPEMPRPGCVWTHVLLIKYADMALIEDFFLLAQTFNRPERVGSYDQYSQMLTVNTLVPRLPVPRLDVNQSVQAIQAMYGELADGLLPINASAATVLVFAIWSQQWPRLRRSFKFRTTKAMGQHERGPVVFDLRLSSLDASSLADVVVMSPQPWELATADDLRGASAGHLRRFLWRYGSDIQRGRKRFGFLARLYVETVQDLSTEGMFALLDGVAAELPDPTDGMLLKKDLLAMGESSYSMLPVLDPLHLMAYLANEPGASAFPALPEQAFALVAELWHQRDDEILVLAERAMASSSAIGDNLIEKLALLADPATFLQISERVPRVRARLVQLHPALLDSPHLSAVHAPDLVQLLRALPDDEELAAKVLTRLLSTHNLEAASIFEERFQGVLRRVLRSVYRKNGSFQGINQDWIEAARIRSAGELGQVIQEAAGSAADLAACIQLANSSLDLAVQLPIESWVIAVTGARDDLQGDARLSYLAFLLALALERPQRGCEPLFEKSFEEVHIAVWHSRLPYHSFNEIARRLPDLPFWQQWDSCLRLRLAVIHAYGSGDLDSASFSRLARDPALNNQLYELSKSVKRMRKRKL